MVPTVRFTKGGQDTMLVLVLCRFSVHIVNNIVQGQLNYFSGQGWNNTYKSFVEVPGWVWYFCLDFGKNLIKAIAAFEAKTAVKFWRMNSSWPIRLSTNTCLFNSKSPSMNYAEIPNAFSELVKLAF